MLGKVYLLADINVFCFGAVAVLVDAWCLWLAYVNGVFVEILIALNCSEDLVHLEE